jgi:hypothetical protein
MLCLKLCTEPITSRNDLGASSADSLGGSEHTGHATDTAVGDDAAGGSEAEVGELAAHARVVLRSAANVGGGREDAGVLLLISRVSIALPKEVLGLEG